MSEVEVFVQRRYRCPHCRRSWASKTRAEQHVPDCHRDPMVRACSTCKHYDRGHPAGYEEPGAEPSCEVDALPSGEHFTRRCLSWEAARWLVEDPS